MRRKYLQADVEAELEDMTHKLCVEHLPPGVTPEIKWNYSKVSMGLAEAGLLRYRDPKISYSRPLLGRTYDSNRIETVYHEVAHLVVFYQLARHVNSSPPGTFDRLMRAEGHHGPLFRQQMLKFGYTDPKGCR